MKTKVVIGCDPGYSSGAVVAIPYDGSEILHHFSYGKTKDLDLPDKYPGDKEFTRTLISARVRAARLFEHIMLISNNPDWDVVALAIEGFVDQKGKMHLPYRWKPPLVLAYLHDMLDHLSYQDEDGMGIGTWRLGENLFYTSADVMRIQKQDILKAKMGKIPHLECLTSNHERSAWAHAKAIKRYIHV